MLPEAIQLQILFALLSEGIKTRYGQKFNFEEVRGYDDYKNTAPLQIYEDIKEDVNAIKSGDPDLIWPGRIQNFAVSAGTTGEGKHLPLTDERLYCDRKFMRSILWDYLKQRPNLLSLIGKQLSIPGTVEKQGELLIGEISGFSALHIPSLLRPFQLISPDKLNRLPFREKFNRILDKAVNTDLRVIIAVPSWILTLFQQALEQTGKESIADVWPNLTLLVCGGVKLSSYRSHLEQLAVNLELDFIETYGASEGYFAYSDRRERDDMKLVYDNGIFYEFVPDPLPDPESLAVQETVPLWEVKPGIPYGMVVSTNSGLWRYGLNDIIEFTSAAPPRIKVKGRLGEILDDYGEALHLVEAEDALKEVADRMDLQTGSITIGSLLESESEIPKHHWFVRFADPVHTETLERAARQLDEVLRSKNRHYAIRRESNALGKPQIHSISQSQINGWLDYSDRAKAQGKIPKMLRNKKDIEYLLKRTGYNR